MYVTIDTSALIAVIGNEFIDVSLEHTVEISKALNIYAYDAYLIQCAQQTSTSLLTLDRRLKIAAEEMGIHVLEVNK